MNQLACPALVGVFAVEIQASTGLKLNAEILCAASPGIEDYPAEFEEQSNLVWDGHECTPVGTFTKRLLRARRKAKGKIAAASPALGLVRVERLVGLDELSMR
jgi:hypothetical protein